MLIISFQKGSIKLVVLVIALSVIILGGVVGGAWWYTTSQNANLATQNENLGINKNVGINNSIPQANINNMCVANDICYILEFANYPLMDDSKVWKIDLTNNNQEIIIESTKKYASEQGLRIHYEAILDSTEGILSERTDNNPQSGKYSKIMQLGEFLIFSEFGPGSSLMSPLIRVNLNNLKMAEMNVNQYFPRGVGDGLFVVSPDLKQILVTGKEGENSKILRIIDLENDKAIIIDDISVKTNQAFYFEAGYCSAGEAVWAGNVINYHIYDTKGLDAQKLSEGCGYDKEPPTLTIIENKQYIVKE